MQTFEGTCRFCGQIQPVMAESPEEADSIVTDRCNCDGAIFEKRKACLKENIAEVAGAGCEKYGFNPLDVEITNLLYAAGVMVMLDKMQQISVSADGTAVKISVNTKGQVKVTRKEQKNISTEV